MQSVIYIMNVLDNPTTSYFNQEDALIQLEKRKKFFFEENPRLETSILILSENDIKNIILKNKDLAKKVLSEVK